MLAFPIAFAISTAAVMSMQQPAADGRNPGQTVRFEVASVKPNRSGDSGGSLRRQPGGHVDAINMPLFALVTFAYQVQPFTVDGAPEWMTTERFDVRAKLEGEAADAAGSAAVDSLRIAMRTLLTERFQLKSHREVRERDIYALVMARGDGKPGHLLKTSAQRCDQVQPGASRSSTAVEPDMVFCGMQIASGRIRSGGMPLSLLANALAGQVGRVVVDRTGLSGGWDFELQFSTAMATSDTTQSGPAAWPSVFTSLQEQLGLRLAPSKGPVDVLVIDNVERPTAD